jgi:ubiquinone/menaquinone biosynthesis C-methylase UbiE
MERVEYALMNTLEEDFWWYRALHAVIAQRIQALQLPAGANVLDAGCGTGGMLKYLAQHAAQYRYKGLEWHAEAASMAEQKTGFAITQGSVNAMPFADQQFAAIISQDVLYHRNVDEQAMLQECYRCLQADGQLLLHVAAFQWMASAHDEHVHGARRYTAPRLEKLLQENGFTVVRSGYWNSLLFPLMMLQRLTVGKHKASSDVETVSVWQNRIFHAVLDAERRWGLRLPFGGSVWAHAKKIDSGRKI